MEQVAIERWEGKDLWSEKDLQELCCGLDPNGTRPCTEELNDAGESIRRGIISKALPCICPSDATAGDRLYGHARFFRPMDAIKWAAPKFSKFPFKVNRQDDSQLSQRAETTYLNIIGGLLELMLGKSPAGKPQSVFKNQAAIIETLEAHFGDGSVKKPGITKRTLEEKFAAANRSLTSA